MEGGNEVFSPPHTHTRAFVPSAPCALRIYSTSLFPFLSLLSFSLSLARSLFIQSILPVKSVSAPRVSHGAKKTPEIICLVCSFSPSFPPFLCWNIFFVRRRERRTWACPLKVGTGHCRWPSSRCLPRCIDTSSGGTQ